MKIYIAGKLTDPNPVEYLKNCNIMNYWGEFVRKLGHSPYIPCNDLLVVLSQGGNIDIPALQKVSSDFLMVCDMLLLCPNWKTSKGCKKELRMFKRTGRPIIDLTTQVAFTAIKELNDRD